MIIELLFIFFIFTIYFFFYVEYKVNKNNNIYEYDKELTRQNINNEILLKMPFYFDGSHLNSSLNVSDYKIIKNDKKYQYKQYNMIENEILLLKPYIKTYLKKNNYLKIIKKWLLQAISLLYYQRGGLKLFRLC